MLEIHYSSSSYLASSICKTFLTSGLPTKKGNNYQCESSFVPLSPSRTFGKTRLEALADRVNDWEDESGLGLKLVTSTPEKNSSGACGDSANIGLKASSKCLTPASRLGIGSSACSVDGHKVFKASHETGTSAMSQFTPQSSNVNRSVSAGVQDASLTPTKSISLDKSVLQSLVWNSHLSLRNLTMYE